MEKPATDFEGDPRPYDGDNDGLAVTDIGADEWVPGPACRFDVDWDGEVDMGDLQDVAGHWHQRNTSTTDIRRFDLDEDGVITVRDMVLVGRQLGRRCP